MKWLATIGLMITAVFIMGCGDGWAVYPNNDGIPNNCEYTAGAYYQPNHFARFDNNNNRLTLVDWTTGGTIFELDTNINAARTSVLDWSPNCQYLITHQDGTGIIYDVVNGGRLASFDDMRGYDRQDPSAVFDQTNTYVTIEAGGITYLHHLLTGETDVLADHYFQVQYFDYNREQLIGIGDDEVAVYNLNGGAKIASFGDLNLSVYAHMAMSPDGTTLAFSSTIPWVYVINRDTLTRTDLYVGFSRYYLQGRIAISPDNRYLAVGTTEVKVWDLQNLQAIDGNQMPTTFAFAGPEDVIDDLHFVDGNILETISTTGDTSDWNMITGEQVDA
jgi:WD40 repeat protein